MGSQLGPERVSKSELARVFGEFRRRPSLGESSAPRKRRNIYEVPPSDEDDGNGQGIKHGEHEDRDFDAAEALSMLRQLHQPCMIDPALTSGNIGNAEEQSDDRDLEPSVSGTVDDGKPKMP